MAAADFVGMAVTVTLKEPPGMVMQGRVADILGQTLFLHNVFFPSTGHRVPQYKLDSAHIADLEVLPANSEPQPVLPASALVAPAPPPLTNPSSNDAFSRVQTRTNSGLSASASHDPRLPNMQGPTPPMQLSSHLVSPPSRHNSLAVVAPHQHPNAMLGPSPGMQYPHAQTTSFQRPHGHKDSGIMQIGSILASSQPPQLSRPKTQGMQFMDPAILSVGRKPAVDASVHTGDPALTVSETVPPAQQHSAPQEFPSTPVKLMDTAGQAVAPINTSPFVGIAANTSSSRRQSSKNTGLGISETAPKGKGKMKHETNATLSAPFLPLASEKEDLLTGNTDAVQEDDTDEQGEVQEKLRRVSISKTRTGAPMDAQIKPSEAAKKARRGKRRRKGAGAPETGANQGSSPENVKEGGNNDTGLNAEGWRQTPMLQAQQAPFSDNRSSVPRAAGLIGGQVGREAAASTRKKERKSRKQRGTEALQAREAQRNGWATEDATDIRELPEFDFVGNLSKFDKKTVFDTIRNEDTTADEDRLVSFNRLGGAAGSHGMRKLHHTENVLDSSQGIATSAGRTRQGARAGRNSIHRGSDDSLEDSLEDEISGLDSGRISQKGMSRASSNRHHNTYQQHSRPSALRSQSTHSHPRQHATAAGSPTPMSAHGRPHMAPSPPLSPSSIGPTVDSAMRVSRSQQGHPPPVVRSISGNKPHKSSLRLSSSGRPCPVLTPRQLAALESAACRAPFHLSPEVIAENAGRGIAQVALGAINPSGKRLARDNLRLNGRPVVVVLAGRTRAGARALVAARMLAWRGVRVMGVVVGVDIPSIDSLEQAEVEDGFGGTSSWEDIGAGDDHAIKSTVGKDGHNPMAEEWDIARSVMREARRVRGVGGLIGDWESIRAELRRLEKPPELIIDALLGPGSSSSSTPSTSASRLDTLLYSPALATPDPMTMTTASLASPNLNLAHSGIGFSFTSLRTSDRALVLDLVGWANASRASVLSVEAPSGLDGITGTTHVLEGEPLEVRARYVVCLGAPRIGLLRALEREQQSSIGAAAGAGAGGAAGNAWLMWCVDLGLSRVWRTALTGAGAGRQVGRGVRFGDEWVVSVRFDDGAGASAVTTGGQRDVSGSVGGGGEV